jgi:hypothetical protein
VAAPRRLDGLRYTRECFTRRLKEALALIDVRVLDHLIVAESDAEPSDGRADDEARHHGS